MKVTVIIPTYNRSGFLGYAIKSVLDQSWPFFELIIVDDGSEDDTPDLVNSFNDHRIRYIRTNHRGVATARNVGVMEAKFEFIAFLDSDDTWAKQKLKLQLEYMETHQEYLFSHTDEIWYKGTRMLNPKNIHKKAGGDLFRRSLRLCVISISTAIIKRELFEEIGLFDEQLVVCEDYDFWLRATARYSALYLDKPLTYKQGGHKDQLSQRYFGMDRFRIYSILKLISSDQLSAEQQSLAISELKRKALIYAKGCKKRAKYDEAELYFSIAELHSL
jgi:glycosyltransferase involved in cell wall biosynthesis